MIGGKWKARMLLPLSQGPQRLASLRRALPPGVSNEVLITQLRGLAADGLVAITVERNGATSFRHYALTPLGESLVHALEGITAWGAARMRERGHEWMPQCAAPSR